MHELTAANQAAHLQHAGSCCHSAFATVKLLYLVHRSQMRFLLLLPQQIRRITVFTLPIPWERRISQRYDCWQSVMASVGESKLWCTEWTDICGPRSKDQQTILKGCSAAKKTSASAGNMNISGNMFTFQQDSTPAHRAQGHNWATASQYSRLHCSRHVVT